MLMVNTASLCVFSSFCLFLFAYCFFLHECSLSHLCEQQYQDSAPAVEVGIVTARGGGISLDHCLLVILFFLGEGGRGFCL